MNDLTVLDNTKRIEIETLLKETTNYSRNLRKEKTDPKIIRIREGKQGKKWKYVDKIIVQQWLDAHYPGWSFQVLEWFEWTGFVYARGQLDVICPISLIKRTFTCYGADEGETITDKTTGKKSLLVLPYIKNAETDALKRCVMRLGGFNDIYTDEVIKDMTEVSTDDSDVFVKELLPKLQQRPHIINKPILLINIIKKFLNGTYTLNDIKEML